MGESTDNALDRLARQRVGTTIKGKYRLERLLGVGGMGAVYAATHRIGGRYAIKILHASTLEGEDRSFLREALLANRVDHPGALKVIDADLTDEKTAFLVLPLLDGETVRARWERCARRLEPEEVLSIARATLEILGAAHASNVVHRDVKPENLFIDRKEGLRILDFGVARSFASAADASRSGRAVGTAAFMAPEQALGRTRLVDGQTDIWSVGATMFTLLTGGNVHEGETWSEVAVHAATRRARALADRPDEIPIEICRLVDRALAFEKSERWPDASSMAEAIQQASLLVFGRPLPPVSRSVPPEVLDAGPDALHAHHEHENASLSVEGSTSSPPTDQIELAATRTTTVQVAGALSRKLWGTKQAWLARPARIALLLSLATIVATSALLRAYWSPSRPTTGASPSRLGNSNEGARGAFEAGEQAWRDASLLSAQTSYLAAVEQDPAFASAHLRLALLAQWPGAAARQHYQSALAHRGSLSEAERALLDAVTPALLVPADHASAMHRLDLLRTQGTSDPLTYYALADAQIRIGELQSAIQTMDELLGKEPRLPIALMEKAVATALLDQIEAARSLLQECLRVAPSSLTCLSVLGGLDANEGQCQEVERIAKSMIANAPQVAWPFRLLASAMYAQSDSLAASRTSLERHWQLVGNEQRDQVRLADEGSMAVLEGHFETASARFSEWRERIANETDEDAYAEQGKAELSLNLETGERQRVEELANTYLAKRDAWLPGSFDYDIVALRMKYQAGVTDRQRFVNEREAWLARQSHRPAIIGDRGLRWIMAFGQAVATEEDAKAALNVLPEYLPLPDATTREVNGDGAIGFTYLLAGRTEEALPYLRRGARSCAAIDAPFAHTWAILHLGMALERTHDMDGACAAYRTVLKRWGREPRSESARRATTGIISLGCSR